MLEHKKINNLCLVAEAPPGSNKGYSGASYNNKDGEQTQRKLIIKKEF